MSVKSKKNFFPPYVSTDASSKQNEEAFFFELINCFGKIINLGISET